MLIPNKGLDRFESLVGQLSDTRVYTKISCLLNMTDFGKSEK